jgi:hypothetical protein
MPGGPAKDRLKVPYRLVGQPAGLSKKLPAGSRARVIEIEKVVKGCQ